MQRTIMHIDMNAFYASVAQHLDPSLRGKAVAVAGDPKRRNGIILAKSREAKSRGVKTAEAIWQAKQKCPELIVVPPDYAAYKRYSSAIVNPCEKEHYHLPDEFLTNPIKSSQISVYFSKLESKCSMLTSFSSRSRAISSALFMTISFWFSNKSALLELSYLSRTAILVIKSSHSTVSTKPLLS